MFKPKHPRDEEVDFKASNPSIPVQTTCQMRRKVFQLSSTYTFGSSPVQGSSSLPHTAFSPSPVPVTPIHLHTSHFIPSSGHSLSAFVPSAAPYDTTIADFNPSFSPSPQSIHDMSTPTLHLQTPTLVNKNPFIDSPTPCASPILSNLLMEINSSCTSLGTSIPVWSHSVLTVSRSMSSIFEKHHGVKATKDRECVAKQALDKERKHLVVESRQARA